MGSRLTNLETKMDTIFAHKALHMPEISIKALAVWMPGLSLVLGGLSLLTAWSLWHWGQTTTKLIGACNAVTVSGCGNATTNHMSVWLWLGVILIATEGILYLFAYNGMRTYSKVGWNYLFYGALLNVAYILVSPLTHYYPLNYFFGGLVALVFGFYLLFQLRALYASDKPAAVTADDSRG